MFRKSKNQNRKLFPRLPSWAGNTAAICIALLLWQTVAVCLNQRILLCSPFDVLRRLGTLWQEDGFWQAIGYSFSHIVLGFLTALFTGLVLGIAAGRFRLLEILLRPYMVTIQSVPVASFIVIALLWLSSRSLSIFISFLMVLPIVYTNTLGAIRSVDPKMAEMARVFGLSFRKRLLYLWIPHLQSYLFSACSVSLGLAWKSGVAAEIIGLPDGSMGERLYQAKIYVDTVDLFAWTVVIVCISVLFEKLFLFLLREIFHLERKAASWT